MYSDNMYMFRISTTAGKCQFRCRCGKGRRTGVPRDAPPAGVGRFRGFRNGRKMPVSLPLWQGAEDRGASGSTSRSGRPVPGLPQRQENAGFAAVVARSGQTGMPQGSGNRSGRKGAEERGNMERRHFMFIPPEGLLRAASPKPSIRRRAQPEYSSGTQQPPRQQ